MNLEQLRNLRKNSTTALSKIASELQKEASGGGNRGEDTRFWKVEPDKAGNGSAVIRFLPAIDADKLPWVKIYSHGFQGPTGKWYIENCLTTIGQDDPVVEHVNELYNSGIEENKKLGQQRKRKLAYVCNILVISDPKHPENEGQIKLFKFGKKIFDKIKDKLHPQFEDEEAVDVFNPWEGANFRLRMRKVDGYANFDKSDFDGPTEISEDDEELLRVLNARHSLDELIAPSQFKSYDELKRKLDMVLNPGAAMQPKAVSTTIDDEDLPAWEEKPKAKPAPKAKPEPTPKAVAAPASDDDDDMSFFKDLVD
jgi:hypothetical protein